MEILPTDEPTISDVCQNKGRCEAAPFGLTGRDGGSDGVDAAEQGGPSENQLGQHLLSSCCQTANDHLMCMNLSD